MCCWIWFCSWILFIYFSSCRTWLLVLKCTLSFYLETRGWQLPALLELYLIKVTHALLYLGSRLWLTQTKPCCSIGGVDGWGCCQIVQSVANAYLKDLWPRSAGALHFTIMCARISDLQNLNSCCNPSAHLEVQLACSFSMIKLRISLCDLVDSFSAHQSAPFPNVQSHL